MMYARGGLQFLDWAQLNLDYCVILELDLPPSRFSFKAPTIAFLKAPSMKLRTSPQDLL